MTNSRSSLSFFVVVKPVVFGRMKQFICFLFHFFIIYYQQYHLYENIIFSRWNVQLISAGSRLHTYQPQSYMLTLDTKCEWHGYEDFSALTEDKRLGPNLAQLMKTPKLSLPWNKTVPVINLSLQLAQSVFKRSCPPTHTMLVSPCDHVKFGR